jgi:hypothetical protein
MGAAVSHRACPLGALSHGTGLPAAITIGSRTLGLAARAPLAPHQRAGGRERSHVCGPRMTRCCARRGVCHHALVPRCGALFAGSTAKAEARRKAAQGGGTAADTRAGGRQPGDGLDNDHDRPLVRPRRTLRADRLCHRRVSHGHAPVPIRWVLIRDPARRLAPQAWLSTELDCDPEQILRWFIRRWQLDTTSKDTRAHVGLKTSLPAERPQHSPYHAGLFGLYSMVTLIDAHLTRDQRAPVRMVAWYPNWTKPGLRRFFWRETERY